MVERKSKMATFLDITLLEKFSIIFPFLLAFVVVYGVLSTTKIFGNNKGVSALFAVIVAFFTFLSPTIRTILNRMAPWFILLFIFTIFVIIAFKTYGATDADILGQIRHPKWGNQIVWFFLSIILIITIGSITSVTMTGSEKGIRPVATNITTEDGTTITKDYTKEKSVFWDTLLHPKVMGLIVILLIANFTVAKLAGGGFPKSP